ncbi:MAG: hypothetical protein KDB05_28555 [Planctomycetales bacterium]|nr:hypothetical protein [Planctomycetales bacterium]
MSTLRNQRSDNIMGRYGYGYGGGYGWKPYVSVAERRRKAAKKLASLQKKGMDVLPVVIEGRKIAKTFWGVAWCDHLESFSDYSNRLPRGRSYVRNGSVCHLAITQGSIEAKVSGSELYTVKVQITKLPAAKWQAIKKQSAGKIGSLLELLQGKLSDQVMQIVTDRKEGLFPLPKEISFKCDCPDWAGMCKHIAAVMYGIGSRLDSSPDLLFTLRGVDHQELIAVDAEAALSTATKSGKSKQLASSDLSDVFGIDLANADETSTDADSVPKKRKRAATKKSKTKEPVSKKVVKKKIVKRKKKSSTDALTSGAVAAKRKAVKKKKK